MRLLEIQYDYTSYRVAKATDILPSVNCGGCRARLVESVFSRKGAVLAEKHGA
jgi:hypothetical protein